MVININPVILASSDIEYSPKTWLFFGKQDFYNLVDVYLDAVFFPKCVDDFQTFQQEGWHYELNDPSEEISYKGWVFDRYC